MRDFRKKQVLIPSVSLPLSYAPLSALLDETSVYNDSARSGKVEGAMYRTILDDGTNTIAISTGSAYDDSWNIIENVGTGEPTYPASNILIMNNGTVNTVTDEDPTNYVKLELGLETLTQVEEGYGTHFVGVEGFAKAIKYDVGTQDFKITLSGRIISDSTNNNDHFHIRALDGAGNVLTGTSKRYAAGASQGQAVSEVGFTLIGFGRFAQDGFIEIEVAKDFTGTCICEELLIAFEEIGGG